MQGGMTVFKVLVVEDDRELNRQVCIYLKQSGYEAVGCLNANDAFQTMYNDLFDVLPPHTRDFSRELGGLYACEIRTCMV